jgi:hypothetical protein
VAILMVIAYRTDNSRYYAQAKSVPLAVEGDAASSGSK